MGKLSKKAKCTITFGQDCSHNFGIARDLKCDCSDFDFVRQVTHLLQEQSLTSNLNMSFNILFLKQVVMKTVMI